MAILYYDGQVAGATDGELAVFSEAIEVLEPDHPRRRFVALMAIYALTIAAGAYPGPYRTTDSWDFARCMLMPSEAFMPLIWRSDVWLAERFAVPIEQVAIHRKEALLR